MLLLSARETEVRGWAECKGNDQARREWLIHAKNRLEATVTLCTDHDILKYLHFSSIAGIVQSKLPYDMVRDFKKILVKHLSPSRVLEKEIVIQLLSDFIDEKIMDCTLGVNLEIVNFLGGAVELKNENKKSDQQRGGNNPKSNSPNNASGPSGNINSNGHSGFSGSNGAKQKYGQHNQQYDGCHDGQYSQRQDGGRGGQHNTTMVGGAA